MKAKLAVCAQSAVVDRFSNEMSIFNVKTRFRPLSFPAFIPELVFIVLIEAEAGDPEIFETKAIVTLNQRTLAEMPVVVKLLVGADSRQLINFRGLPVEAEGVLTFRLLLANEHAAVFEIEVNQSSARK